MKVIRETERREARVVALGTFDGVHRGHQALLEAGKSYAREHGIPLRACSFDRHPLEVLRPETAPKLLTTLAEKARWMAAYGADELLLLPFTRETADLEPEEFLRRMRENTDLRAVVAGWNYTFGRHGKGNAETLREDGRRHGYDVLILPPVKTGEGETISSTLIRTRLQEGKASEAERLMGHPYELRGKVTSGKQMGRKIGVPTANVQVSGQKLLPAFGVYPCEMITEAGSCPAAVNIGLQPTLPSGRVTVEANALDGAPDLYGQHVVLIPGDRIRPEHRFESPEELAAQIRKDRETVRQWWEKRRANA